LRIAVHHEPLNIQRCGLIADLLSIVARRRQEHLEGRQPLLPVNDLERWHLLNAGLGAAFQHNSPHKMGKTPVPTGQPLNRLSPDILPKWFPLLELCPDIAALINRHAIAVAVL